MSETELQLQLATMQKRVAELEKNITQVRSEKDGIASALADKKNQEIQRQKSVFEGEKRRDIKKISSICESKLAEVTELVDSFTLSDIPEVAGRMEIKALEQTLSEVYPPNFVKDYKIGNLREFADEGEAYQVYVGLESRVARLHSGTFASKLFALINLTLLSIANCRGVGSKVALVFIGVVSLTFLYMPLLFVALFAGMSVCSAVYGIYVKHIFSDLTAIKAYINAEYDEDVFSSDKDEILGTVNEFLEETQAEYSDLVNAREFTPDESIFDRLDASAKKREEECSLKIEQLQNEHDQLSAQAGALLEQLDKMIAERKEQAEKVSKFYLQTCDWKNVWLDKVFLGLSENDKIHGCALTRQNTLYISSDLDTLQRFTQLVVFQCALHMHPSVCGQIILDYKYMGSNLLQFARLPSSVCDLHYDTEELSDKVKDIVSEVRARSASILQTCTSIEDFNELMASYGAPGETYMVVHMCGLQAVNQDLRLLFKNGPKVGYYFKIYLTIEEITALSKDFPYDDIQEYGEIKEWETPRTVAQIHRIVG